MKRQDERGRIRRIRNGAMSRIFSGKGNEDDAKIARDTIADICQVNEKVRGEGIDKLIELAKREGMREVWLNIAEAITVGLRERDELTFKTLADSEENQDGWNDSSGDDAVGQDGLSDVGGG